MDGAERTGVPKPRPPFEHPPPGRPIRYLDRGISLGGGSGRDRRDHLSAFGKGGAGRPERGGFQRGVATIREFVWPRSCVAQRGGVIPIYPTSPNQRHAQWRRADDGHSQMNLALSLTGVPFGSS